MPQFKLGLAHSESPKNKKKMKLRVRRNAAIVRFFFSPLGRILIAGFALVVLGFLGTFTYVYAKYSHVIDQKLQQGPFGNTAKIMAAPILVGLGDIMTPADVAAELRRSGYTESHSNKIGFYQIRPNVIEISPGPESYFEQVPGKITFSGGRISQILSLRDMMPRSQYQLEPQLITNLTGSSREKRRMVKFRDIPPVLVQAVTSAEDKRFFQHAGLDPFGIVRAVYVDIKEGRKDQGASTLSQQLARMLWLDQGKRWTRKLAEMVITLQIEQKLSKEEIFEDYANQIDLGWHGTFNIRGFGQASDVYLGKDLSSITLPEAAELAGMIQRPAKYDPFRHKDRTKARRDAILELMRQNGYIDDRQYAKAVETDIIVPKNAALSVEAPYFVDLVNDTLENQFKDTDFHSNAFRIYTTLDMRLQRAAVDAVRDGMALVDQQIKKQRRFKGQTPPEPQVALVALDPHTGEIKALVGGRNYGLSQLNHVLAKRQPGSIFKPFVYAAALDTAVEGASHVMTPSTMVVDQPTTFWMDGRAYEPHNFDHKYLGEITFREALAHSINVAAVKVAQMAGYDAVVDMAKRAGLTSAQPTPAVALGSYEVTPLEAAGAYTIFANQGDLLKPTFIRMVRAQDGKSLFKNKPVAKHVLDPRVSYLLTNMMEEVLRTGTAAGARAHYAFNTPAAGKTGTSRDGWFAGYTSEHLCVVWVGFDDNADLDLEGAHSAAPIWMEFMKKALDFREYRNVRSFEAQEPDGIIGIDIDPQSGMPATPNCPTVRREVYIAGTQPVGACPLHGGGRGVTNIAGWETPASERPATASGDTTPRVTGSSGDGLVSAAGNRRAVRQEAETAAAEPAPKNPAEKKEEKKSLLRRIFGVFK